MDEIRLLLEQRRSTHGEFKEQAQVSQALKDIVRESKNWDELPDTHREALDMLVHKMARILCGNLNHKDSWDDIAGYAILVSDRIK